MKKVIIIIAIVLVLGVLAFCVTGCGKKQDNNNEEVSQTINIEKDWPDLAQYGITKLDVGNVEIVENNCGKNGYFLNYKINVSSITREEINAYLQNFQDWDITESDEYIIAVINKENEYYSVMILIDESTNSAEITITAI